MGINIKIIDTGPRTYNEWKARQEVWNSVNGVSNTVFANNGTTETVRKTKNKVASITIADKEITPDKVMVYKAKLDEKDKTTLKADLQAIEFGFWLEDKNKKEVKLHENITYIKRTKKDKRYVYNIKTKGDLASADYTTDFTDTETIEEFTIAVGNYGYHYAKVTRTETEAVLEIKFSKWMDSYRVRMEAYYKSEKPLGDGNKTTASHFVKAEAEILEAYWLNAKGEKITTAGYKQDLYLYLKTLGLTNKIINTEIHEKDYYNTPSAPKQFDLSKKSGDELIEWKNNQIEIDNREVIKQFKVGDKTRYDNAAKDEAYENYRKEIDQIIASGVYTVLPDFIEKDENDYNLELYIHFPEQENLKLDNKDNEYSKLNLTDEVLINNAFFAIKEKHEVQKDATQQDVKNKKGKVIGKKVPTTKVTQYKQIDKGVLGQTVQLVAECPNLDSKATVEFKVYESNPLLAAEKEKLHFIYNEKPVCVFKAKVDEGFAVVEIKLQHKKEHKGNKDWLDKLKNGFYDAKDKTAELYIKVEAIENVFTSVVPSQEFLKDNSFKLIGNNWHEPVDDPQIAMFTQGGYSNPQNNTYGTARTYTHAGLDIFALEGSNIYACLDAEVLETQEWRRKTGKSGYGHNITLKVKVPQEVRNRKREYTLAFKTDKKEAANFNPNSEIFLLRYAHLEDILVKVGDKVKAGQIIGKTGISGVIKGTSDPHLHFNIYSDKKNDNYLVNPAYYVYWKEINDLTVADKKTQEDRKNKYPKASLREANANPAPKLSIKDSKRTKL